MTEKMGYLPTTIEKAEVGNLLQDSVSKGGA